MTIKEITEQERQRRNEKQQEEQRIIKTWTDTQIERLQKEIRETVPNININTKLSIKRDGIRIIGFGPPPFDITIPFTMTYEEAKVFISHKLLNNIQ